MRIRAIEDALRCRFQAAVDEPIGQGSDIVIIARGIILSPCECKKLLFQGHQTTPRILQDAVGVGALGVFLAGGLSLFEIEKVIRETFKGVLVMLTRRKSITKEM
jgi:hypothetical protein